MDWLLTLLASTVVRSVQLLPLNAVARLGRFLGNLVWHFDRRHREVALNNLTRCLGDELDSAQIQALARENFRRIGENFTSAVKTAIMTDAEVKDILEVDGLSNFRPTGDNGAPVNRVMAVGHFGNFELFAKTKFYVPGYQFATTYRALREPGLNRVLQSLREQSGCLFFERRFDAEALKTTMRSGQIMLGLLSDQHGGHKGIWGPFLGQKCSTTPSPAVFALRYHCDLHTAFCYRIALGRWRIEVGDRIATHQPDGQARPIEDIIRDINREFEAAVRRDPANWFWVHRRWKPQGRSAPPPSPPPADDTATPA